ncbi:hypothetical protein WICMUC_004632 [Wickerhamomyces mucosus]|uniref:Zn(2)-C6 fungal-type domain-containing protein n=1 Tax=Wickerhamomyces mucosus TaxID=1378264 RepID=A0A9P8TAT8_9ASCO|nr:hypothetical protein WICMUC_004632 [Wickerhamomyces mucosus]
MNNDDYEHAPLSEDFLYNPSRTSSSINTTQKNSSNTTTTNIKYNSNNSNNKNKPKKKRIKPCTICKRRKIKCIKENGNTSCNECIKRNYNCILYDNNAKNNNINDIDKFSKPIILPNHVEESCNNCLIARIKCIKLSNSSNCLECTLKDLINSCKIIPNYNNLNEQHLNYKNLDYNSLNETGLKNSLHLPKFNNSILINPSTSSIVETNLYFNDGIKPRFDDKTIKFSNFEINVNNHLSFKTFVDSKELINYISFQHLDEISQIVQPFGLNLINLYFQNHHQNFPIIDQNIFLEKYLRNFKELNPLLVLMVYLFGLKFKSLDKSIVINDDQILQLENLMEIYYIDSIKYNNKIFANLQSYLLILNYEPLNHKNYDLFKINDKFVKIINQLVLISEDLGLNYCMDQDNGLNIPRGEIHLKRIIAWNIITFDKLINLIQFKSSKIDLQNWLIDKVDYKDSNFIKFNSIISEISKILHNLKSIKFDSYDQVKTKYLSLNTQLMNHRDLLRDNDISIQCINYLLKFILHRRILKNYTLQYQGNKNNSNLSIEFELEILYPIILKDLIDFYGLILQNLNKESLIEEFWINKNLILTNVIIYFIILVKSLNKTSSLKFSSLNHFNIEKFIIHLESLKPYHNSIELTLNHLKQFQMI